MATRPVFVPGGEWNQLVRVVDVTFKWNPGLAPTQKKKNIAAMHEAAGKKDLSPLLEISTKSEELLGQRLSAFSLKVETNIGPISVESAFQGSKVFADGGPYTELYELPGRAAKRDPRLRKSGRLIKFKYFDSDWPVSPRSAFYDWLYLSALKVHTKFLQRLYRYKGFTDIEFNPSKSINCQARACALLVSLMRLRCIDDVLRSERSYLEFASEHIQQDRPRCELL